MQLYKFTFSTYEEYYTFELTHEKFFENEQIEKMKEEVLNEIKKEQKEICEKRLNENDEFYNKLLISNYEIVSKMEEILIKKYGFNKLVYTNINNTNIDSWYDKFVKNYIRDIIQNEETKETKKINN